MDLVAVHRIRWPEPVAAGREEAGEEPAGCAHGSYAGLLCGTSDRGRFCHVLRAPSRAAATPHTVHDAYALG